MGFLRGDIWAVVHGIQALKRERTGGQPNAFQFSDSKMLVVSRVRLMNGFVQPSLAYVDIDVRMRG